MRAETAEYKLTMEILTALHGTDSEEEGDAVMDKYSLIDLDIAHDHVLDVMDRQAKSPRDFMAFVVVHDILCLYITKRKLTQAANADQN